MRRTSLLAMLVACAFMTGCAAPSVPEAEPTQTQTPPPIESIQTSAPEPAIVPSTVDVATMKSLWDAASDEQRADVLAQVGLTSIPDDVTDEMVAATVQQAAAHGVDVTPDDVREFLAWATTN